MSNLGLFVVLFSARPLRTLRPRVILVSFLCLFLPEPESVKLR